MTIKNAHKKTQAGNGGDIPGLLGGRDKKISILLHIIIAEVSPKINKKMVELTFF